MWSLGHPRPYAGVLLLGCLLEHVHGKAVLITWLWQPAVLRLTQRALLGNLRASKQEPWKSYVVLHAALLADLPGKSNCSSAGA